MSPLIWICICIWIQLAGVVGVEVTGGPEIPFHPGREVSHCSTNVAFVNTLGLYIYIYIKMHLSFQDKPEPPPEGRLPDANLGCPHLRDVFVKQMGLTDKDIVVLSGAHTIVSIHSQLLKTF